MKYSFLIYLKNKTSLKFEYRRDVSAVIRTDNGYHITFNNGRSYSYGADKVKYYPFISTCENVRIYENGKLNEKYDTVDNYGHYLIFRNGDNNSYPIEKSSDIEICNIKKNTDQAKSIIDYFKEILKKSGGVSFDIPAEEAENKNPNQISSEILLKALEGIDLFESRSALSKYINGTNPAIATSKETLIYPFGCNESQKLAVETTLRNSISIVEGPPGTGKTQTILNIIANLIVQNKTVAIVSNNNSAVFNVREKLEKYGYGMVVASLGNKENKTSFFDSIEEQTVDPNFKISEERLKRVKNEIEELDSILTKCFQYRNKLATLKTELSDAEIEFNHIKAEQPLNLEVKAMLDKKFCRKWNYSKILSLKDLLSCIEFKGRLSLKNTLRLFFHYGLFDLKSISLYSEKLPIYANHKFYELYITKIENEILDVENWLASNNEESNLKHFIDTSKEVFNGELFKKYNRLDKAEFNAKDYRKQFNDFAKRYPVILSSTLSLHTSIPNGYLFDYLIIDESSQVDIIKAAVCFSCCRNVIVVGDSLQLTHIVDKQSQEAAEQFQVEYNISPAYDYVKQNILNSLKSLYGDNLKSVLLKEHYRCHPTIIGFCNKKYYNNNLVVMTEGSNHPFRIIETNISGERDNYNQRQIDETDSYIRENFSMNYTEVGVIAPYRKHADMLQKRLPNGAEADTIHKFQGREKDVIIFNTVRSKIGEFIDNPNLINVAVSRAVKEFIVVKPESMELPHGTNIGDMIRYICYTTNPNETIVKGRICSVFDLLYKEYNKAFTSFLSSNKNIKGSAAEIIIDKLLNENILKNIVQFSSIDMVREYRLRDLVRDFQSFSEDEIQFIRNNSRIDFLLYNKMDKTPVLAIEVDGVSFHDNKLQQERDNKKDHILEIIGLPLLRLSTDGHNEEARIIEQLNTAMAMY
uniref:AAA domain-containing protein n=1 Tax=uncultured Dysgonomonas sp. TaxID=206096 RepID=UPI0026108C4A|nr:AAA domain-containing protein [uncultured Dysgonomonas sp.]